MTQKTVVEFVKAMQREYTEIESINESIKELKEEAKSAGHDATLLAKLAKSFAESKTDDLIEKSQAFIDLADEVRNS